MRAIADITAPDRALPRGFAAGRRSPRGVSRWYAVRVPEGREAATAARLRAVVPAALMPDVFSITKERWFKRGGEWSLQAKPLFPGWLVAETPDPRALAAELARLSFPADLATGDGRTYLPMSKEAQAFYESHMDAGRCLRNSVGSVEGRDLRICSGPLAGREAEVLSWDRRRRFCLVAAGEGAGAFTESMPLDIPPAPAA